MYMFKHTLPLVYSFNKYITILPLTYTYIVILISLLHEIDHRASLWVLNYWVTPQRKLCASMLMDYTHHKEYFVLLS